MKSFKPLRIVTQTGIASTQLGHFTLPKAVHSHSSFHMLLTEWLALEIRCDQHSDWCQESSMILCPTFSLTPDKYRFHHQSHPCGVSTVTGRDFTSSPSHDGQSIPHFLRGEEPAAHQALVSSLPVFPLFSCSPAFPCQLCSPRQAGEPESLTEGLWGSKTPWLTRQVGITDPVLNLGLATLCSFTRSARIHLESQQNLFLTAMSCN